MGRHPIPRRRSRSPAGTVGTGEGNPPARTRQTQHRLVNSPDPPSTIGPIIQAAAETTPRRAGGALTVHGIGLTVGFGLYALGGYSGCARKLGATGT